MSSQIKTIIDDVAGWPLDYAGNDVNVYTYENMVDIIDELEITSIARYALVDMGEDDRSILASYLGDGL